MKPALLATRDEMAPFGFPANSIKASMSHKLVAVPSFYLEPSFNRTASLRAVNPASKFNHSHIELVAVTKPDISITKLSKQVSHL